MRGNSDKTQAFCCLACSPRHLAGCRKLGSRGLILQGFSDDLKYYFAGLLESEKKLSGLPKSASKLAWWWHIFRNGLKTASNALSDTGHPRSPRCVSGAPPPSNPPPQNSGSKSRLPFPVFPARFIRGPVDRCSLLWLPLRGDT